MNVTTVTRHHAPCAGLVCSTPERLLLVNCDLERGRKGNTTFCYAFFLAAYEV